jgi:RNA polymerase sigma-70 factor (ECF subfamily)
LCQCGTNFSEAFSCGCSRLLDLSCICVEPAPPLLFDTFRNNFVRMSPKLLWDTAGAVMKQNHTFPTSAARGPSFVELARLSDEQLMASLKTGCNDALAILFDRYHRLVLSIALRIVRDPGEAEDVMQTVFLEIFRAVGQFDPAKGTTKMWILQYAYHRAFNRRRHLNARNFYDQTNLAEAATRLPMTLPPLGAFTQHELKHLLRQGLATLTGPQKQVVELVSYDGLSMKEIATKTGESLSNVRHYYYRGLQRLRSFVGGTPKNGKMAGGYE